MHSDIFVCFWTEKPFVWLAQTLFEAIFWHGSTINWCEEWPIACRSKKPGKIWCCRSIWVHYSREKVRLYSSFRFHLRWTSHYCPFSEKVIVFFLQFYSLALTFYLFLHVVSLYLSLNIWYLICREQRPQDFLDCIVDLREYDVPYHVRFAIDNGDFLFLSISFEISFLFFYLL